MITTHLYEFFFGYVKIGQLRLIDEVMHNAVYVLDEVISRVNPINPVTNLCYLTNLTEANEYCAVAAGTTPYYAGQLVDYALTPIGSSAVTTMTLTLIDTISNDVVNNADHVNILNTGRGSMDADGNLVIGLLPGDTAIYNSGNTTEERSILINVTFNSGLRIGAKEILFTIVAPV